MSLDTNPGSVDELAVSTVVRRPPGDVYEFLFDFDHYPQYSEHVDAARVRGEGEGARFRIRLSWWRLSYVIRGVVTDVDPPNRIGWEVTRDVDARGYWGIEPVGDPARGDGVDPEGETDGGHGASVARLYVEYDPTTIGSDSIGLPPFVSIAGIVDRIRPVARREAERIAERAVADVEDERRPVQVQIDTSPDAF